MARRLIVFTMMAMALLAVPAAQANTGDIIEPQNEPPTATNGWQAASCLTDEPVSGEPKIKCSPQTPGALYKQAGGHPPIGFTQYIIQHEPFTSSPVTAKIKPPLEGRTIKTLRVDLPPGETVNPNATPTRCSLAEFLNEPEPGTFVPTCDPGTKVGEEQATLVTNAPNVEVPGIGIIPFEGFVIPPTPGLTQVPVYNLQPKPGEPALFGFVIAGKEPVFLETEVAWESDFHESFTIQQPNTAAAPGLNTLISRLINFGASPGDGTYINKPTTCFDPSEPANAHLYSTWFRAQSYEKPDASFPNGSTPVENKIKDSSGNFFPQEGCGKVPFDPGLNVDPGTSQVDSPAPATVNATLKFLTGAESEVQESHLRKAVATLPTGMGLNPAGSNGLLACSDAQFKKGQRDYSNSCPADSKVGSVEVESPPLSQPLRGDVYVGEQKSSNPTSGEEFRILVEAKEEKEGIDLRLVGNISANPTTGQLTTTFDEQEIGPLAGTLPKGLPQVPFKSVKLRFDGSRSVLTSPPTCSAAETTGQMEPWARPGEQVAVSSKFTLSSVPGGGTCPTTLAARKFAPSYTAKSDSAKAGAYSPFRVHIGRPDGQQELKVVNVTLPKGLTGNLSRHPLLLGRANWRPRPQAAGKAEQASPSCSTASRIGAYLDRVRNGGQPGQARRQRVPGRPLQGRPALAGGDHAGGLGAVRPRHRGRPGGAQRQPGNRPDQRGVRCDPGRVRRGQAGHPLDRRQRRPAPSSCSTRRTAPLRRPAARSTVAAANPANPAAFSSYAVDGSVPGDRMQQARLQAEAAHPPLRPDQAGEEPADPGDPGSPQRRRQRQPHGADAAALAVPRPEPHQDRLHPAAAGLADVPDRRRSTATRKRSRRCSARS